MKKIFFRIIFLLLLIFTIFIGVKKIRNIDFFKYKKIPYSEFINNIENKNIKKAFIKKYTILAKTIDNKYIKTLTLPLDKDMLSYLTKYKIKIEIENIATKKILKQIFISWFPTFTLTILWMIFIKQIQNYKEGSLNFNSSKAKMVNINNSNINFSDVAGCEEAKKEMKEIVNFLKNPKKFKKLGGHMPHGVLMIGPPGIGKTLLARAMAGEAKVPFFTISGSDFVELFVGIGASRVRNMFAKAKYYSPSIIFIDEIDAVGRHRSYGISSGNSEREQTLNQMLVEMDGFEKNSKVIVLAATNRIDVLDKALLRPGRFDRKIIITLPDIKGRKEILKIHIKKIPISLNVKINVLARSTPGFSGADLSNLINEAAINAANLNKNLVEMQDFESAKDKIIMGEEKKSVFIREYDRISIAYHESGHTIVAKMLPKADPVHKVTIIPRGYSLGLTWQLPKYDKVNLYKERMLEEISILLAGRISEIMFLNHVSTGASNDLKRATKIARNMIICYGMSKKIGTIYYKEKNNNFYGNNFVKNISDKTQQKIDKEIKKIINQQYKISKKILKNNKKKVKKMVKKLLKKETLNSQEINKIMKIKN